MMRHCLVLATLCAAALCQKPLLQLTCDPEDGTYKEDPDAPKLKPVDGFEIFAQVPLYLEIFQDVIPIPILEKPYTETFFFRSFADQQKRGSLYIAFKHKMVEMMYDRTRNESMIADFQFGTCDVKEMVRMEKYPYGYFHGEGAVFIPFMDRLLNLERTFKVKRLENGYYRGFRNVVRYESCVNIQELAKHVLQKTTAFPFPIPEDIINNIPNPTALRVRWMWADPLWEMEDGSFDTASWVPLGLEISGAISIRAKGLVRDKSVGILVNASMAFANYHSHYPHADIVNEDLLQAPQGFNCKRQPPFDTPEFPRFPPKFHIKTESVSHGQRGFSYNSEDYYDYDHRLYRFDVSLHRPGSRSATKLYVFYDETENVVFEINRAERTCSKQDLSEAKPDWWKNSIVAQLIQRPNELLKLDDMEPNYIGKKPCRGMNCHFWSGQKDFKSQVDGKNAYGVFGVWATTTKWSQNFSTADDPLMKHFVVELDAEVRDKDSNQMIGMHHLQIFDYKQITSNADVFFLAPTNEFCGNTESGQPKQPSLPTRYQYRGEYSDSFASSSIPIFVNYDVDWNVIRFDWIPAAFDTGDKKTIKYRQAYVYDRWSGLNFQVNLVTNECVVKTIPPEYQGEDIDPLHIIWPPRLHEQIVSRNMRYIGVQPCRRMSCDTFELDEPRGDVSHLYEYQFTTSAFKEISVDNPSHEEKNVLARIARLRMEKGELVPDNYKSVDVFGYIDQRSVFWEYEIASPCFNDVYSQWIRLYFTPDSPDALNYIRNDYFVVEMMEAIRKNSLSITPLRISDFRLEKAGNDRIVAEFKLRDRHPMALAKGPSLDDVIQSLSDAVSFGNFTVKIVIPSPDQTVPPVVFQITADKTLEQCNKACSVEQWSMPTIELDLGLLAGTIIGSVVAGVIVIGALLTILISRKHQVPMQSLYFGTVPGTGVSHDLPHVSMSGGIAVGNNDEYSN